MVCLSSFVIFEEEKEKEREGESVRYNYIKSITQDLNKQMHYAARAVLLHTSRLSTKLFTKFKMYPICVTLSMICDRGYFASTDCHRKLQSDFQHQYLSKL